MKLLQALALIAVAGLAVSAPAKAEMIFRNCMVGTPNIGKSCTYNALQQCQIAASAGVGFCQENPAYTVATRQAAPAPRQR